MEIDIIKKLIKSHVLNFEEKRKRMDIGERYYKNESDITQKKTKFENFEDVDIKPKNKNPMRNADNRIPFPYHKILVDQKASYMMGEPPKLITDIDNFDDQINNLLGNKFNKVAKDLVVNAANMGVAWLHVWKSESDGSFKYGIVDSRQIIPIFSPKLDSELLGCFRVYPSLTDEGKAINVAEYWTEKECEVFYKESGKEWDSLQEYNQFDLVDIATNETIGSTNVTKNEWGKVPFIPFFNNSVKMSDLDLVKDIIDAYEKVFSGFVNDLDDLQEVIFILTNYSGTDKQAFLNDMKTYKMLKFEVDEGEQAGIDTLQLEIPIEARKELLDRAENAIYNQGMGVNPTKDDFSNTSGAALKFIYSLLELKAGVTETEFRLGFDLFMEFVLMHLGKDPKTPIEQNWQRSSIQNVEENADILSKLADITSKQNIAKNNPLVPKGKWEEELKLLEEPDSYDREPKILEETLSTDKAGTTEQGGGVRDGVQPAAKGNAKVN